MTNPAEPSGFDVDQSIEFEDATPDANAPSADCGDPGTIWYTMACTITSGLCPS